MARALTLVASFALIACSSEPVSMDSGLADSPFEVSAPDAGEAAASCGIRGLPCCNGTCNSGAVCTAGTCTCPMGTSVCGPACAPLMTDVKNCGACDHDCLGGQCNGGKCQPITLVPGQNTVSSIAVDNNSIYWTRNGNGSVTAALYRSKLDGTGVMALYDAGLSGNCVGAAVDGTNVYFACQKILYKCKIGGCNMQPTALSTAFANGINSTALDDLNDRLYFTIGTTYNQSAGGFVGSVPTGGFGHARLVPADQPNPTSITVQNGIVYWLNSGTYTTNNPNMNGSVKSAPPGMNQAETLIANDTAYVDLLGLGVDPSKGWWGGGSGNRLRTASLGGGTASDFGPMSVGTRVTSVVVDQTFVYFTTANAAGTLSRCSKGTCMNPEVLASNQNDASSLAQDDDAVYWGTAGAGEIRKIAK